MLDASKQVLKNRLITLEIHLLLYVLVQVLVHKSRIGPDYCLKDEEDNVFRPVCKPLSCVIGLTSYLPLSTSLQIGSVGFIFI